jgi:hypothetical protein
MMVYTCNPSYSEGGGRRIQSLRPTWAKLSRQRLYLKKKIQTKGLEAGQVAELFAYHKQGPGFNPHYHTHTKKKKKIAGRCGGTQL